MSVGYSTRHRSSSSAGQNLLRTTTPLSVADSYVDSDGEFRPCEATAAIFLVSLGSRVPCLHHDTLAVERRFEKHKRPVKLLSVDNVSERGAGRLVVSYDEEQTAIVWDLFTGDEITRFASFKPLKVAAWMKDGNIAFGMYAPSRDRAVANCLYRRFRGVRDAVRAVDIRAQGHQDDF